MQSQQYTIGVDIGGTTVKAGAVNDAGEIIDREVVDARGAEGPPVVIGQIVHTIEELRKRNGEGLCKAVGMGCPGVVSLDGDNVSHPPNLHNWEDVKLATEIRNRVHLPARVGNDANCAALAEARFGAGKEYPNFLFVIWGTGVGGGIIIDRKIFEGGSGGAGEIGHLSIDYNGPLCGCGSHGCIEAYIGQRYFSERTRETLRDYPASQIVEIVKGDFSKIEPKIVSQAALKGDEAAIKIFTEAGTLLGYALASAMNVLDVPVSVIGGGISAAPEFVYDAIRASMKDRILKSHVNPQVVRAELGNPAGIIGAASLVM